MGITVVRIEDYVGSDPEALGQNLNMVSPSTDATDQVWEEGTVVAIARGRYSSMFNDQRFGYFLGEVGGDYVDLFDVPERGCDPPGMADVSFAPGVALRWARSGAPSPTWTSRTSENGGEDHLVTYRVLGVNGGANTFLLFWEDLPGLGDADYNELVVELVVTSSPINTDASSFGRVKARYREWRSR